MTAEFPTGPREALRASRGVVRVVARGESAEELPLQVDAFESDGAPLARVLFAMISAVVVAIAVIWFVVPSELWAWTWTVFAGLVVIVSLPLLVRDARARADAAARLAEGFARRPLGGPTDAGMVRRTGITESEGNIVAYWSAIEAGAETFLLMGPQRSTGVLPAADLPRPGDRVALWRLDDGGFLGQIAWRAPSGRR